jgi:NAD(P)-dependent dehydrogenase (short-subunit alcohol dehydrogenase family)
MPMLPQSSWSPTFAARTEGASGKLAAILALAAGTDLISFAGGLPARDEVPLGRFGTVDEVSGIVVFLASDRAAYLTGTSIDVAGGMGKYV